MIWLTNSQGGQVRAGDYEKVAPDVRLQLAALKRAEVETEMRSAVAVARAEGLSWAKVGKALGTTGQAASERYANVR